MQISTIVLPAALCTLVAACGREPSWTASSEGFGLVHIGMTVEQAEQKFGRKFPERSPGPEEIDCDYAANGEGNAGFAFMIENNIVVRVDVFRGNIATDKGARVGDTEKRVLDLYAGRIRKGPHFYTGPEGHYLRVSDPDGRVRLIFETDGKVVTNYHAGREETVEFVEVCQ